MIATMNASIAAFVRDEYTPDGVEVEGEGANRVRLRMPPSFHNVTRLCRDLVELFGANVDLVIDQNDAARCVVFEVFTGGEGAAAAAPVTDTQDECPVPEPPAAPLAAPPACTPERWAGWVVRMMLPVTVAWLAFVLMALARGGSAPLTPSVFV